MTRHITTDRCRSNGCDKCLDQDERDYQLAFTIVTFAYLLFTN